MSNNIYCPINGKECGEGCAFFIEEEGMCSMEMIARSLKKISEKSGD